MTVVYDLSECCGCGTVTSPCCPSGDLSQTLHADFTSACAAWNGITFDLVWNGSNWEGQATVHAGQCGDPCTQTFQFTCDAVNELWKFIAINTGGTYTGCTAGACLLNGQRTFTTDGTSCSPLDINMTAGSLAVAGTCGCCTGTAVTVRVYE